MTSGAAIAPSEVVLAEDALAIAPSEVVLAEVALVEDALADDAPAKVALVKDELARDELDEVVLLGVGVPLVTGGTIILILGACDVVLDPPSTTVEFITTPRTDRLDSSVPELPSMLAVPEGVWRSAKTAKSGSSRTEN